MNSYPKLSSGILFCYSLFVIICVFPGSSSLQNRGRLSNQPIRHPVVHHGGSEHVPVVNNNFLHQDPLSSIDHHQQNLQYATSYNNPEYFRSDHSGIDLNKPASPETEINHPRVYRPIARRPGPGYSPPDNLFN